MRRILNGIMVLFFITNSLAVLAYSGEVSNNLILASATISGTATLCQNSPGVLITFTGSGGTEPYTFTYNINGGTSQTATTTGSNSSITVPVNTATAGTLNYNLTSVHDSTTPIVEQPSPGLATITVSSLPVIDFSFIDNQCSGTAIQFSSTATGTDTYSYAWNFGDGTTSTQQNPSHSFTSLGCNTATFTVSLTVTGGGCTVTKTKTITVKQKPDISFEDKNPSATPSTQFNNCAKASISNNSYTITVGNVSTSSCITSFSIDWGDGITENNVNFPKTHNYPQLGTYNMVITALGNNGCSSSKTYIVKNISNPSGGILNPGGSTDMCIPTPIIQYTIGNWATNSPGTIYSIDYGDGSSILNLNQDDMVKTSYYNPTNPASSANYPVPYSYNTNSCPNNFIITLTASNACKSTVGTVVGGNTISNAKPNFTAPLFECSTTSVLFTNTSILGYSADCSRDTKFTWDFGDPASGASNTINTGFITTAQNANHIFSGPGTYTVTLTANSGGSCNISPAKTQQICIEPPLTPQFTLNTPSDCTPQTITATNITVTTNSCSPPTYIWKVVHTPTYCGTTIPLIPNQTTTNASYNFTVPGTYSITLSSTNSCGTVTSPAQIVTIKKPPTVVINTISNLCGPNSIIPTATVDGCAPASSTLTYAWSFPGGTPSTSSMANPGAISYATTGTYTVSLSVTNDCGTTVATDKTFVVNPVPVLTNTPLAETICSGTPTTLVTLTSNPAGATFTWTASATASITGFLPSGSNTIPVQTISTTNTSSGTVTYAITPLLNGCPGAVTNYVITVNPAPAITAQPSPITICLGGSLAPLSFSISGSTGTPTYQWYSNSANNNTTGTAISGETNPTFSPSSTSVGTVYYYCVITLPTGGCSTLKTNATAVTINPNISITTQPTPTQNLCIGATIATPLSVTTTGGAGTVSYQWYSNTSNANSGGTLISGATTSSYSPPVFTGSGNFFYYVVASPNGNSCSPISSDVAEIIVADAPVVSTQPLPTQSLCQGSAPTNLTIVASGGVGPTYSYQWYSSISNSNSGGTAILGATTATFVPPTTTVGTVYYYGSVSQTALGCNTKSNVAQVIIKLSPAMATQPQSSNICLGQTPSVLSVSYTNGAGTPQYQWFLNTSNLNSGGTSISGATNATFSPPNSTAGTNYYYCVITFPSGGCSVLTSAAATVIINANPVIANKSDTICSSNALTISPDNLSGDTVPTGTTYTWSNPIISPAGVITGASAQATPQTSISQTLFNSTVNPATATYTVTPKTGTCPGATFTVTVLVNPGITPNLISKNSTCFGLHNGSFQTNISGGIPFSTAPTYQISWSGPNGFSSNASNISNLAPGNYTLSIMDNGGCPFTNSYTISEPNELIITTDLKQDISCFNAANGAIAITATGGTPNLTYTWTKNGFSFATTKDLSNLSKGNYTVSVVDANNCTPATASYTIIEPAILDAFLVNKTNVTCFGDATGSISINATGGRLPYTFAWTGPNGFTSSNQNINSIYAGNYNVVVTDNSGCTKNLASQITQNTEILITAQTTPIICYGDNNATISISISGGNSPYQIQWDNLATGTFQNNLSPGNYTVTITDALNCIKTKTINIPDVPVFTVAPIVKNVSCFGNKNGSINLNLVGGIAPVKLVWSDGSVAGTVRNNLGPGTYTATITDSKPCTITKTFVILEPQALSLSANVTPAFDCTITNSGAIQLLVSGGTLPYTYLWSNGATTKDLANIGSGDYLVTVTDANNCTKQAQYNINRPAALSVSVVTKTDFDCQTKVVKQSFLAQVSGGVPPYNLTWSSGTISGANNEIMNTNQNGTVILNVTDAIGCKTNYTFNVSIPKLGTPSFTTSSYFYLTFGTYSINDPIQFTNTATVNFVSVNWDFGDGSFSTELNPIHTYINPKEYVVTQTVTYPFGCVYIQKTTLTIGKGYVLVVPNAFTPNNDTVNDTFRPVTKALKNVHLDVYDTWGSMIYSETGTILHGWDGKIKGYNAENGNYYCKVSGETVYGTIVNENHPFVLIK